MATLFPKLPDLTICETVCREVPVGQILYSINNAF